MKKCAMALPLVAMCSSAAMADTHSAEPKLADITARLMYEESGTLSEDITASKDFVAWNVVIGGGSAKEHANDLLVGAVLTADEEMFDTGKLTLRALDKDQKVVGERTFNGLLIDKQVHQFLYLENVGCAGPLTLEAQYGEQVLRETISLMCGE